ncbi:MAG: DNA/RNA non-specific endonuclease [Candidatus Gastranaerophilales bacterium]|nr:DNA/RNA non-specific endonuclease [Candidatus Gastranaerophilales bacterium]
MKTIRLWRASFAVIICLLLSACSEISADFSASLSSEATQDANVPKPSQTSAPVSAESAFSIEDILPYTDHPFVVVNDNIPYFFESDLSTESFESYSDLDELGRCGAAYANIGVDIMPTQEREEIGQIKPSGWHLIKYDNIIGKYLYNRGHLIGYQLSGENANEKNLITVTRYMNVVGMLPFENLVADYVKETENHVLYRVTPIFEGDNLLASGVLMEAQSVEDNGEGVLFCVYVYNVQPDIIIDYATGESWQAPATSSVPDAAPSQAPETLPVPASEQQVQQTEEPQGIDYILNTNTHKFHYPSCDSVDEMRDKNKWAYTGSREDILSMGYEPCKRCNP